MWLSDVTAANWAVEQTETERSQAGGVKTQDPFLSLWMAAILSGAETGSWGRKRAAVPPPSHMTSPLFCQNTHRSDFHRLQYPFPVTSHRLRVWDPAYSVPCPLCGSSFSVSLILGVIRCGDLLELMGSTCEHHQTYLGTVPEKPSFFCC